MGKVANIRTLNENSVFSLHFLTDVLKRKLICIKNAEKWYIISLCLEILIFHHMAQVSLRKRAWKRGFLMWERWGNIRQSINFIKKFSRTKIYWTRTVINFNKLCCSLSNSSANIFFIDAVNLSSLVQVLSLSCAILNLLMMINPVQWWCINNYLYKKQKHFIWHTIKFLGFT